MEKQVAGKTQAGVSAFTGSPHTAMDLLHKKHAAAMKNAEELLNKQALSATDVSEHLNCGKLTRLINYIKNGSIVVLMLFGYTQFILY